jgi:hypothetical protein
MSKKKALIKETVVRRWGKLANIHPLTETFIDKTEIGVEVVDDEELTEAVLQRVVERLLRRK